MNNKQEQTQFQGLCIILNATVGMDKCDTIGTLYAINKLRVTSNSISRTRIKDYPTEGNNNF